MPTAWLLRHANILWPGCSWNSVVIVIVIVILLLKVIVIVLETAIVIEISIVMEIVIIIMLVLVTQLEQCFGDLLHHTLTRVAGQAMMFPCLLSVVPVFLKDKLALKRVYGPHTISEFS